VSVLSTGPSLVAAADPVAGTVRQVIHVLLVVLLVIVVLWVILTLLGAVGGVYAAWR
jgi:hypothetical protein